MDTCRNSKYSIRQNLAYIYKEKAREDKKKNKEKQIICKPFFFFPLRQLKIKQEKMKRKLDKVRERDNLKTFLFFH